eukprot:gene35724-43328_t
MAESPTSEARKRATVVRTTSMKLPPLVRRQSSVGSIKDVSEQQVFSTEIHEIDYVGTGTFQVSQMNLLNKRSAEPIKSSDALLSARGLHHRSRDVFVKDIQMTSGLISGLKRREKMSNIKSVISAQLVMPCFQRALAYERLNKIDGAIDDYSTVIRINPKYAPAYFNRGGLYKLKKDYAKAIDDLNMAVNLDPGNVDYRASRSLLFRESGHYHEAVKDTILTRALIKSPNLAKALEAGVEVSLDSDMAYITKIAEDPILVSLAKPGPDRSDADKGPIIDYLKGLKFFSSFQNSRDVLDQIASKVELITAVKGEHIFEEGQPGNHFYIILDGEISIVKIKKSFEEILDTLVLVRMFRGQTFGET